MLSHFPLLSTQQRFTPYYDSLTSTFASLGAAAPQAYFNGHDHIQARSRAARPRVDPRVY